MESKKGVAPFSLSDSRFRALVEKSWDVLVLVDNKARVVYATPSIIRLFGRDYKEFMGIAGLRFVHPADYKNIMKTFFALVTSAPGNTQTVEMRIAHKDGYYKWIEATATNYLSDPEIRAVVINFHDITASKELEERKNEFISIASHELKTPMTSLKLYTQILSKTLAGDEAKLSFVRKIENQVAYLTRLVNDLLDATRLQENKVSLRKEKFVLATLVESTIADLQRNFPTHPIQIKSTYAGEVFADKFRINQVLINLVSNAIKFSPEGKKIEMQVGDTKDAVTIHVKDYGMGISKSEQKKVFERFFQSQKHGNRGGLGLGLYISNAIVQQHNGHISIDSEKGKGATFTISLPKE